MIDLNTNTYENNSISTEPRFIGASSTKLIMCGSPAEAGQAI
jgi:hypothetical protein